MLFIGVLSTVIAVVIISRMRVFGGISDADFGWMSDQWLAEYRASNPT